MTNLCVITWFACWLFSQLDFMLFQYSYLHVLVRFKFHDNVLPKMIQVLFYTIHVSGVFLRTLDVQFDSYIHVSMSKCWPTCSALLVNAKNVIRCCLFQTETTISLISTT